ncbi:hypothetical protein YC2023_118627 [Brassica napus]
MHGWLMDQKILDGNTEVAPVATRVHVNGLRGLFPLEKITRKMHISFCETPSNVSVNDSELESDDDCTVFIIDSTIGGFEVGISKDGQTHECNYPHILQGSTSPSGPQISPSVFHYRMFKGCIGTVPVGRVEPGYGCDLCTLASVLDMIRDGCIKIPKADKMSRESCVCGATLWMRAL